IIPVLNWAFRANLRDDGFDLKVRQSRYYSLLGIAMLILSVLFAFLVRLPSFMMVWVVSFVFIALFEPKLLSKTPSKEA
ncbi:MAG: hypothetical protein AAFO69_08415, partial [Bacteroidota bacterium]